MNVARVPLLQALAALLLASLALSVHAQGGEVAGTIKTLRGSVFVVRAGQSSVAELGMPIQARDTVRTGADGSVGITLRDQTLLTAGPNATVELRQFQFDSTTQGGAIDAHVRRGSLAVVSGAVARTSPQSVRFSTPAMTLGVRGTEFIIDAGDRPE